MTHAILVEPDLLLCLLAVVGSCRSYSQYEAQLFFSFKGVCAFRDDICMTSAQKKQSAFSSEDFGVSWGQAILPDLMRLLTLNMAGTAMETEGVIALADSWQA